MHFKYIQGNIYLSIIDRYSVRPNSVEDMCYADFGALLTTPTIETPSKDTNIMAKEVQCEELCL
jgi:hypothetical protein